MALSVVEGYHRVALVHDPKYYQPTRDCSTHSHVVTQPMTVGAVGQTAVVTVAGAAVAVAEFVEHTSDDVEPAAADIAVAAGGNASAAFVVDDYDTTYCIAADDVAAAVAFAFDEDAYDELQNYNPAFLSSLLTLPAYTVASQLVMNVLHHRFVVVPVASLQTLMDDLNFVA